MVRRRLPEETRGSFVLAGSNLFERPMGGVASDAAWKHRSLQDTIVKFADKARMPVAYHLIRGPAGHDLYHAQIRLLGRLNRER